MICHYKILKKTLIFILRFKSKKLLLRYFINHSVQLYVETDAAWDDYRKTNEAKVETRKAWPHWPNTKEEEEEVTLFFRVELSSSERSEDERSETSHSKTSIRFFCCKMLQRSYAIYGTSVYWKVVVKCSTSRPHFGFSWPDFGLSLQDLVLTSETH